jgi:hypothetical protein
MFSRVWGKPTPSFLQETNVRPNHGTNQFHKKYSTSHNPLRTFTLNVKTFHAQQTPFVKGMGDLSSPFFKEENASKKTRLNY